MYVGCWACPIHNGDAMWRIKVLGLGETSSLSWMDYEFMIPSVEISSLVNVILIWSKIITPVQANASSETYRSCDSNSVWLGNLLNPPKASRCPSGSGPKAFRLGCARDTFGFQKNKKKNHTPLPPISICFSQFCIIPILSWHMSQYFQFKDILEISRDLRENVISGEYRGIIRLWCLDVEMITPYPFYSLTPKLSCIQGNNIQRNCGVCFN